MFQNIGKKIGPFYFTIGGIGDILLCLSGFYNESIEPTSIIVWSNDRSIAKEILDKKLFPRLKHIIITDNFVGYPDMMKHYDDIVSDVNFKGKFHIPDNLQYVKEWASVSDVFSHYGINRNTFTLRETFQDNTLRSMNYSVIHPYSLGRDGVLKGKVIENDNIAKVLVQIRTRTEQQDRSKEQDFEVVCVGSPQEQQMFRQLIRQHPYPFSGAKIYYPTSVVESMRYVANAAHVYSADSWTKTMSGLCGIPTTAFTCSADMSKLFPQLGYDPSDNIFMNGWGFEVIKQFSSKS